MCDADGNETGLFEVPAGGHRYRALELRVRQKRLAKTAPVPCIVRESGIAEEDLLAENIQRAPLHPLDQFRAFLALREKGQSEEEIAAAFFVSVAVVKQRLRLASVSPTLLDIYAEDRLTLDHSRQEQVWEALQRSYTKEAYMIRRLLTEGAVRASDKRAQFTGIEAYEAAGGAVLRDLFQGDDGGWLQDVALVGRLVAEKLEEEAETIRAEGWKWIEVAPEFPYGHTYSLRQLRGDPAPLTYEEEAARDALQAEHDRIEATYAEAEELPDDADQRLGEIETALAAFDERPVRFEPFDIGRAGAFISIDGGGHLRVERGYVRPEDEAPVEPDLVAAAEPAPSQIMPAQEESDGKTVSSNSTSLAEVDEDEGSKPIPDRLMTELTAYRTLALRQALGEQPDIAFLAALHALCIKVFYRYTVHTCLELDLKNVGFGAQAPGLSDTALAASLDRRHRAWIDALPQEPAELWDVLTAFDRDSREALLAHCVSLSVNAMLDPYTRRPQALAHADRLAKALDLDPLASGVDTDG